MSQSDTPLTFPSTPTSFEHFLGQIVLWSYKKARFLIFAAAILTVGLTLFVAKNISVRTDTDEMIDPNLPFRQAYESFQREFPQISNTLILVIRSPIADTADDVRDELVKLLGEDKANFETIYAPGHGQFFKQNGLLFLDQSELEKTSDRLSAAQPILANLSEDPSLSQFFDLLRQGIEDGDDNGEALTGETLQIVFEALLPVFDAQIKEGDYPLSWVKMFDPNIENEEELSHDSVRFIIVQPKLDPNKIQPAKAALAQAKNFATQVLEGQEAYANIEFTGKIALNADELKSVSQGAALAGLLSAMLVSLILGFGFRSWKLVLATLLTLIAGLIWTAAFAIATIGYLNIISVAFAVLFIGLGIDFGVHFALRYGEQRAHSEKAGDAMVHTARTTGAALAICAPTTALAFFAFVPTAYVGLSQLGIISGTGIFISLLASLTLLPALLKVLPGRAALASTRSNGHVATFVSKYGVFVAGIGILTGIIAAFIAPQARFNADPIRLKDPTTASVQAYNRLIADSDTSPYVLQLLIDNKQELQPLKSTLKNHEAVHRVVSFESFIPNEQGDKLGQIDGLALLMTPILLADQKDIGDVTGADLTALTAFANALRANKHLPSAPALSKALDTYLMQVNGAVSRLHDLQSAVFKYWPQALDRLLSSLEPQFINADDVPANIKERYIGKSGKYRLEIYPKGKITDEDKLKYFVTEMARINPNVTGSPVQIVEAGAVVKNAMMQATGLAALLVSVFLLLLLRNIRQVLLILIPIALAGVLTLAASALLPLPFNFANVIVLPLLIGLGVDSGIHLVSRAHERENATLLSTSTPRAVFLSALTTLASFGTLALSSHQGTASMGALLFIAIFFTLLCTLVVLPALIHVLERRGHS